MVEFIGDGRGIEYRVTLTVYKLKMAAAMTTTTKKKKTCAITTKP